MQFEPQLLRDSAVLILPRGPAGTKLLRGLLGEVPWASLSPVTRNANGTSRYSTTVGALSLLEGLTHAVFFPLARRFATAAAAPR